MMLKKILIRIICLELDNKKTIEKNIAYIHIR